MDYKQHLAKYRDRREKILAFLSTGKTQGQAAIKFGITRQRVQQIAKAMRNGS